MFELIGGLLPYPVADGDPEQSEMEQLVDGAATSTSGL